MIANIAEIRFKAQSSDLKICYFSPCLPSSLDFSNAFCTPPTNKAQTFYMAGAGMEKT